MKKNIKLYRYRTVEAGDTIEIYNYSDMRGKNMEEKEPVEKEEKASDPVPAEPDSTYKRKTQTIYRTKQRLRRLIQANQGQYEEREKFITLTFEEFLERREVQKAFDLFNRRMKYNYPDIDYYYIGVIERGSKATKRLHLHCLFFNLPFIDVDDLQKIWKYGFVKVNAVNDIEDLSLYILKYLEKTIEDGSYIPKGQKFYFTSRNLKRPVELFLDEEEFMRYMEEHEDKQIIYADEFEDTYVGDYQYMKLKTVSQFPTELMDDPAYVAFMEDYEQSKLDQDLLEQ